GEEAETVRRLVCAARALGHIPGPEPAPSAESREEKPEAPRPIFRPQPGYTETALAAGVRGTAVAKAVIDVEGCVADARIETGLASALALNLLDALRFWTFYPAIVQGKPVRAEYTLTANFAAPDPSLAILQGTVEDPGHSFALPGVVIELRS